MPRARNIQNRGYPKSWRFRYDAYYYRVPKGQEHLWDGKKEFRLGRSLGEAAAEWAKRVHRIEHDATVDALLTRYKLDVIPSKAAATRRGAKRNSGSVLMIQAYIRLKLLIGIRRGDMLRLRMSDLTDAGIIVRPHKTRNTKRTTRIFEWTPALKQAVEQAKAARPIDISPWLFCTREGEGYFNEDSGQATGWDSMWQRFMTRLLKDTAVKERFTEHDLRGKVGSDVASIERATDLLGHASKEITKRHYRRKPEVINPFADLILHARNSNRRRSQVARISHDV